MMLTLLIILLIIWLGLGLVGLAVKGLIWLFWIGLILFVATAIIGWVQRAVKR